MLLAVVLTLSACAPQAGSSVPPEDAAPPAPTATAPASPPTPTPTVTAPQPTIAPLPRGTDPANVSIPAIGLEEPLIGLGLTGDGAMEVPADFGDVGWFTGGGRPGGHGPVVIAGHVDSRAGPAVFARLHAVRVGDAVTVTDVDGVAHRYVVTETADHPRAQFPTARVFGAVADDQLRLITCTGVFDRDSRTYSDNRVVYAERVDE